MCGPLGNTLRAELMADNYLFTNSDAAGNPLSIFDRSDNSMISSHVTGIVDLCVSNKDILFTVQRTDTGQILSAYTMVEKELTSITDSVPLAFSVQSLSCLDGNNILLNPDANSQTI
jgi:hypothetical protein